MLLVGIDWADDHHDAALLTESGEVLEELRFSHDQDGFDLLHGRIKRHVATPDSVLVAIETKHGLLVHDLLRSGYTVYGLNPKAVNRYKDRLRSSDRKDDKLDAKTLAHVLRTDRHLHRALELGPDDYRLLERLSRDLSFVVNDTVRLSNRLLDSLKEWYPAAIGVFGLNTGIFLDLLTEIPGPASAAALTHEQFSKFLKKHRYSAPLKAQEAFQRIKRRTPKVDPVAVAAGTIKVKTLVEQLRVLHSARKNYEQQIKQLLDKLPEADIISSLPGVGKALAPAITSMFGSNMKDAPKRFEQAKDLSDLAGCSPVTKQSGKFKTVNVRHACDTRMRCVARNWAGASLKESLWAKTYYEWNRLKLQSHETILRKLAAKWIKIAYYLWKNGEMYDEAKHIAMLKSRNVAWAASL